MEYGNGDTYHEQKHRIIIKNKSLEYLLEEILDKGLLLYIISKDLARETYWKHGCDERVGTKES